MRIIAFINKDSGPCYHRVIAPLMLMPNVDVFITNDLNEKHFDKGCDMFMYNRVLPEFFAITFERLRRKYGFKVCVDIDDYWVLDSHHVLHSHYNDIDFEATQSKHIKHADIVTVTNSNLAKHAKALNTNVHVLPNAIPKIGQFDITRKASPYTRLFWQGSQTHRKDIEILAPCIRSLTNISSKIKMVIAGYGEDCLEWKQMIYDYTNETKFQYKIIPAKPIHDYYAAYSHADICLVPLIESTFNVCKSNLKVLEAANLGLPCIVSNVQPYKGLPVMYVNKYNDWQKQIRRLVGSRRAQKEEGLKLKDYCDKHYNFDKINLQRKQILGL